MPEKANDEVKFDAHKLNLVLSLLIKQRLKTFRIKIRKKGNALKCH